MNNSNNVKSETVSTPVPVVLVHGMWSHHQSLKEIKQEFEALGHPVLSLDLPWHRPPDLAETPEQKAARLKGLVQASMNDYVDHVVSVIKELEQPPILVGHSMGGLIAQLAAVYCELSGLIVLSSASPAGVNGWHWTVVRTLGRNLLRFPLWKRLTRLRLSSVQYGIANTQSEAVQREIFEMAVPDSGRVSWQIAMWFLYRQAPTRVAASRIQCPILIIGGGQDRITPFIVQQKIARMYGGRAQLIRVEEACHWIVGGSNLPKVMELIAQWIEKTGLTPQNRDASHSDVVARKNSETACAEIL